MIERIVYQCEHCKQNRRKPKIYFTRDMMFHHEIHCFYNLDNKSCFTCDFNHRTWDSESDMKGNECLNKGIPIMYRKSDFSVRTQCPHWVQRKDK